MSNVRMYIHTPLYQCTQAQYTVCYAYTCKSNSICSLCDFVSTVNFVFCLLTALHFASEVGSAACVESLLKSGAGANSQDNNGQTALVLACIGGHTECIKTVSKHAHIH